MSGAVYAGPSVTGQLSVKQYIRSLFSVPEFSLDQNPLEDAFGFMYFLDYHELRELKMPIETNVT